MKYVDLHCDTLTACFDGGCSVADCNLQINLRKLKTSRCAAQCFAIFTQGDGAALRFEKYLDFYLNVLKECELTPVHCYKDLKECYDTGGTGAILTVENVGFIDDISYLSALKEKGVEMASLVWNYENSFAYPNLIFRDGQPRFDLREGRGLKDKGRRAVEALDGLKIIVDVSHLSDGGTDEILSDRKIPVVASHSNAFAVNGVSRNLTDLQIKKIAACGGAVGINFCKDFLGEGDTFGCVLRHLKHLINTGGEDVVAFGSDFDGIPAPLDLEDCTGMPRLLEYLEDNGISGRVLEKLCYKNFARVFKEVVG